MGHSLYRKYQYGWTRELDHNTGLLDRESGETEQWMKNIGEPRAKNGNEVLELAINTRLNSLRIFLA